MLYVESKIGTVHRRTGQHRGCHERGVPDHCAVGQGEVADQLGDADADREQVEDRLEEAGDEDDPGSPVDQEVPLDDLPAVAGADRYRDHPGGESRHQLINLRVMPRTANQVPIPNQAAR